VFNNCRQFIRTVPALPRDEVDMDDVDSRAEDHVGDETRYGCRSRSMWPWRGKSEVGLGPMRGIGIISHWQDLKKQDRQFGLWARCASCLPIMWPLADDLDT
jgi:hypothetical protein